MNIAISFKNRSLGPYTEDHVREDWNNPKRIMGASECRAEITEDPIDTSKHVLAVKFPKGKVGQEKDGGGAQWRIKFDRGYQKCTVEYKVFFPVGFDFVKGGKLPGLCGGTSPGGGRKSDGSDGFSARIMWRQEGEIFQYMYWMERRPEKKWGDDLPWTDVGGDQKPFRFVPGKWHTIKTEINMNTSGKRDGSVLSWFDGKLALSCIGAFKAENADFDGTVSFNFTSFFGGNTPDWAPTKDEIIYFSDFKVEAE